MTVTVTPCLWYVVGMKLVCPMSKFPQAPFARAPFGECRSSDPCFPAMRGTFRVFRFSHVSGSNRWFEHPTDRLYYDRPSVTGIQGLTSLRFRSRELLLTFSMILDMAPIHWPLRSADVSSDRPVRETFPESASEKLENRRNWAAANGGVTHGVYYEARIDYTNNSKTSLLCNRCACNWKISSQRILEM